VKRGDVREMEEEEGREGGVGWAKRGGGPDIRPCMVIFGCPEAALRSLRISSWSSPNSSMVHVCLSLRFQNSKASLITILVWGLRWLCGTPVRSGPRGVGRLAVRVNLQRLE